MRQPCMNLAPTSSTCTESSRRASRRRQDAYCTPSPSTTRSSSRGSQLPGQGHLLGTSATVTDITRTRVTVGSSPRRWHRPDTRAGGTVPCPAKPSWPRCLGQALVRPDEDARRHPWPPPARRAATAGRSTQDLPPRRNVSRRNIRAGICDSSARIGHLLQFDLIQSPTDRKSLFLSLCRVDVAAFPRGIGVRIKRGGRTGEHRRIPGAHSSVKSASATGRPGVPVGV